MTQRDSDHRSRSTRVIAAPAMAPVPGVGPRAPAAQA